VPRADPVAAAAMTRRLEGCGRDELAFSGPRGSNGIPPAARSRLSVGNCRRAYRLAVALAVMRQVFPKPRSGEERAC
jgi:hypothetical protein